jgi:hypothetical protein
LFKHGSASLHHFFARVRLLLSCLFDPRNRILICLAFDMHNPTIDCASFLFAKWFIFNSNCILFITFTNASVSKPLASPIHPSIRHFHNTSHSHLSGYIGEVEIIDDRRAGKVVVNLIGRLNKCGVISPRFDVGLKDIEKWTNNLLPSRQFGKLVLTTSAGALQRFAACTSLRLPPCMPLCIRSL